MNAQRGFSWAFSKAVTLCILMTSSAHPVRAGEILPPEASTEVIATAQKNMGGGWAKAKATLYRNGLVVIEGQAVSNAAFTGTRATVNVIGVDRKGNALFVTQHLDIPTACSRTDATCSSNRTGSREERIPAEIAKYVSHMNIHFSERQGPNVFNSALRNIRDACSAYDELPVVARAAMAAYTGFPGCNPAGLGR